MKKIIKGALVLLFALCNPVLAQSAVDVGPASPIVIAPPKNATLVLEDSEGRMSFDEARSKLSEFRRASELTTPNSVSAYWVALNLRSTHSLEHVIRIVPSVGLGWKDIRISVVDADGKITEIRNYTGVHGMHNRIANENPLKPADDPAPSQYALYTLRPGQSVTVFLRMYADQRFPPKAYAPQIVDHQRYLEMRRLGLYIEGALAGAMLALAIFGWYNALHTRNAASYAYSIWILFALVSAIGQPVHDGQRLFELFIDISNIKVNHLYLAEFIGAAATFGQSMMYVIFARTFLELKDRFPVFYKVTHAYIMFYFAAAAARLLWDQHIIPAQIFWLPIGVSTWLVLMGVFTCAFIRMREGFEVARFFMIAMLPYLLFRTVYILNVLAWPSPLSFLPDVGIFYFIKEPTTAQAFGVALEALIMALAVVARTRMLQEQLSHNIQVQKELVENQNRVLEATVAERTRELEEQHDELEETHQIVIGSVNYASRLQRSQLPRAHRLEGRFVSLGVVWEPRDTIGGDLWWISSSQQGRSFSLAVADCTGHGVPGAMLSLLVSNSLERIYSADPEVRPSEALMSLDYLVRTGLNQDAEDSESDDGCDAAIIRIDRDACSMEFASAKIGLFHLSTEGMVRRHVGSRASLGYRQPPDDEDIPLGQMITYSPGDVFVIVTDGFTDQPGGDKATPVSFGYRRIERLLVEMRGQSADQISQGLRETFNRWQGAHQRRDDVTAVVFSL